MMNQPPGQLGDKWVGAPASGIIGCKGSALTPQVFLNPGLVLGLVTPAAPAGEVYHHNGGAAIPGTATIGTSCWQATSVKPATCAA